MVDYKTMILPPHFTLDIFFGGGMTLDARERPMANLRHVGSVSDLAIAFQNITNTFSPRWPNHPLIYKFSRKLKVAVRFQLTTQGTVVVLFRDYVKAAIMVENNLAAATNGRHHRLPPQPMAPPARLSLPSPYQAFPLPILVPMDLDGAARQRGPLTQDERLCRAEAGLCAYCAAPSHTVATCPRIAHTQRAQGTYVPPGFQVPGFHFLALGAPPRAFLGPWTTMYVGFDRLYLLGLEKLPQSLRGAVPQHESPRDHHC